MKVDLYDIGGMAAAGPSRSSKKNLKLVLKPTQSTVFAKVHAPSYFVWSEL